MKTTFLFLSLTVVYFFSFAQKRTVICGKVKFNRKFIVHVFEPINGYYNATSIDTLPTNSVLVNGTDSIYKAFSIDVPTFVDIRFQISDTQFINRTDILLFPGDSVNLHFNLAVDNPDWVEYHGANAAGQKLFNEINYQPYPKFALLFEALNRLPRNKNTFIQEMDDAVQSNMKDFVPLKIKANVSEQFIQNIELSLRMLYYAQTITKFTYDYPQREVLTKSIRDSILDVLMKRIPATNSGLRGLYQATLYLNSYFEYLTYKKLHLDKMEDIQQSDVTFFVDGRQYIVDKEFALETFLTDKKIQEDMWAIKLLVYFQLFRDNFDPSLIDQYDQIFPDNKWKNILRTKFPSTRKIVYLLQSPIRYIDSTKKINQFDELLKEMPAGKPILVDCWATWCRPCIATFAYNKLLDSVLKTNNIERLYISIDNPANRLNWEKTLTKYCLGGYHILANNELITDIKKVCNIADPEKSPIMIPRYLLVDKNGAVVLNDAASPTDFEQLKEQIETSVLKN